MLCCSSTFGEHGRGPSSKGRLSDSSAVRVDLGVTVFLCRAPHLPHQELYPEQRLAQAHPRPHEVHTHIPRAMYVSHVFYVNTSALIYVDCTVSHAVVCCEHMCVNIVLCITCFLRI